MKWRDSVGGGVHLSRQTFKVRRWQNKIFSWKGLKHPSKTRKVLFLVVKVVEGQKSQDSWFYPKKEQEASCSSSSQAPLRGAKVFSQYIFERKAGKIPNCFCLLRATLVARLNLLSNFGQRQRRLKITVLNSFALIIHRLTEWQTRLDSKFQLACMLPRRRLNLTKICAFTS